MNRLRRRLAATLTCAVVLALAPAATAAAETKIGEASSIENPSLPGEADILAAGASYDTATGTLAVSATTREAPGSNEELFLFAGLFRAKSSASCVSMILGAELEEDIYPILSLGAPYTAASGLEARWNYAAPKEEEFNPENGGKATKSVSGAETTLVATTAKAVEQPFNCVAVAVLAVVETETTLDYVMFPLSPESTPQPSNATRSPTTSAPVPAPASSPASSWAPKFAPGMLWVANSKPVRAKAGKWTKVRFKVANVGGTEIGPIAFKAKGRRGVILKSKRSKLPALLGGQTWVVTLHVKLTDKAKAKSRIFLTGTSGGLTATGSVVVKSTG